jgi:hypothetical protein
MSRSSLFGFTAALLLLVTGAQALACDLSDACVTISAGHPSDCDQPSGDNCLCCCHHIVPVAVFVLEVSEAVYQEPPPEPLFYTLSRSLPISLPPEI